MNRQHIHPGTMYVIPSPNDITKQVYAVALLVEPYSGYTVMMIVEQFSMKEGKVNIELPQLVAKKVIGNFLRLKAKTIIKPVFFGGKEAIIDDKTEHFLSKETLFYSATVFNDKLQAHLNEFQDDEVALPLVTRFNFDIASMMDWLLGKLKIQKNKSTKSLEIYVHGIYKIALHGSLGSEKVGYLDVLVWKKFPNDNQPLKSTYYVFPLSYKKPSRSDAEEKVEIFIHNKPAYVSIASGRRVSYLRFSHPLYDPITKKPTTALQKTDLQKINQGLIQYYSKII
jgi:hypothetical protein